MSAQTIIMAAEDDKKTIFDNPERDVLFKCAYFLSIAMADNAVLEIRDLHRELRHLPDHIAAEEVLLQDTWQYVHGPFSDGELYVPLPENSQPKDVAACEEAHERRIGAGPNMFAGFYNGHIPITSEYDLFKVMKEFHLLVMAREINGFCDDMTLGQIKKLFRAYSLGAMLELWLYDPDVPTDRLEEIVHEAQVEARKTAVFCVQWMDAHRRWFTPAQRNQFPYRCMFRANGWFWTPPFEMTVWFPNADWETARKYYMDGEWPSGWGPKPDQSGIVDFRLWALSQHLGPDSFQ